MYICPRVRRIRDITYQMHSGEMCFDVHDDIMSKGILTDVQLHVLRYFHMHRIIDPMKWSPYSVLIFL